MQTFIRRLVKSSCEEAEKRMNLRDVVSLVACQLSLGIVDSLMDFICSLIRSLS